MLLGPNAAGKSNFLDVMQILSGIVKNRTLKDAFDPPYRGKPLESFTFGREGIKGLIRQESPTFSIEVDVELSQSTMDYVDNLIHERKKPRIYDQMEKTNNVLQFVREKFLRYRIEVEIIPKTGMLRVVDESLAAINSKGKIKRNRRSFFEKVENNIHLRMEGQAHPTYYDCNMDRSILSMSHYEPHYPHLAAMQRELESWFFFYFEPREKMRALNPVKEVRHIGMMGEELASFLNTLKAVKEKQFEAVEVALHSIIPEVNGIEIDINDFGEVELKLLEGKTPIPASLISEGTLRILGLLAFGGAKDIPSLIGFEEPENGIHPTRIRMIADLLKNLASEGNTQLIVTTHSLILADMLDDEDIFVCRKENEQTKIRPFSSFGSLFRRKDLENVLIPISEMIMRGYFDV